ncbi:hypothetical protein DSM43276_01864 [Mycobacteroides salmoniphilum]|nr:hypothetical protein DSM43276_01864 [Mycobacteroides salmoniphilum]
MAFYPQDGTNRSLPYWDYFDDQWRVTIPWRGIGRMIGETIEPHTGAKLAGLGPLMRSRSLQKIGLRAASVVAPAFRLATLLTTR